MQRLILAACLLATHALANAASKDQTIRACLSCHIDEAGKLDIVGIKALDALPPDWQMRFEDAFDMDSDGIAGRLQFVSGHGQPLIAKWGSNLAAARFEDFALIASAAHAVPLESDAIIKTVKEAFAARSPSPTSPFATEGERGRFDAQGCPLCHVTETFEFEGQDVMPLSDFLLHDMGGPNDKPKRTKPLWGYSQSLWQTAHAQRNWNK
ncbi:hypothetical protein [Cohaesibacter intestini]|uniref:hypothetical protein n=1 Tax=Cohaesibacter intestini TaxID=2211145 RepID=UPI000DE913E4|nr:hypothetical protein [Cohaesibacter intestini]